MSPTDFMDAARAAASASNPVDQISQVYGGGLIPILAGLILSALGIHRA
jgi:hypothetical protein